jgi:tRNA-Thr(GGU) m(6)t(6)A37 methyltransferase TsaA
MSQNAPGKKDTFQMVPIGYVRSLQNGNFLEILEPFRPGLKQLDKFSHVMVFWWADQHDNEHSRGLLQTEPPYAQGKITGVFACRAEYRPNPIAVTTTRILGVDEENGMVQIATMDAFEGTPIVDLKAYFPVCDRVKEARIPEWLADWPDWIPEEEFEADE